MAGLEGLPFAEIQLQYTTRVVLSWFSAAMLALLLAGVTRLTRRQAAGIAIMSVPLWLTVWSFINTIQVLADPQSTLQPVSRYGLSTLYYRSLVIDLGYVGAGFLVYVHQGPWRRILDLRPRDIARAVRDVGVPLGNGERSSIAWAWAVFPIFIILTAVVSAWASGVDALQGGDESRVWDNMTPYHAILISLAAGFGEELVYRGFLLAALTGLFSATPLHKHAIAIAIAVQAVIFGFAHAGYGTIAHVIGPLGFGAAAGMVAVRFGLWAAITLHVLVDLYVFGAEAGNPVLWWILGALLTVNMAFSVGYAAYHGTKWWKDRQEQPT